MTRTLLVTGGAGFIGGCLVRRLLAEGRTRVINYDALTYAGNLDSVPEPDGDAHVFVHADVCDAERLRRTLDRHQPDAIVHCAAETHVDRSIERPASFVQTNVVGTSCLLDAALRYWRAMPAQRRSDFRLLHLSTDEVYGALGATGKFSEASPYSPNSPYSASKASADHLVRAWHHTFRLPTLIAISSNNFGPYQFPEKLIPLMTLTAIRGQPLPIYGDGLNVRDWLYVEDQIDALLAVLDRGRVGETYNVGGDCERTNLEIVRTICRAVHRFLPDLSHRCEALITFVEDRPGHDHRYALDASKIRRELGWRPRWRFEAAIADTVRWYAEHCRWAEKLEAASRFPGRFSRT